MMILVRDHDGVYQVPCGKVRISKPLRNHYWWKLEMSGVAFYRDSFEQIISVLTEIQRGCVV